MKSKLETSVFILTCCISIIVVILDVFILEIQERINFADWALIIESGLIAVVQVLRVSRILIVYIFEVQSRSFSCIKFFTQLLLVLSWASRSNDFANRLRSVFLLTASLALQIICQWGYLRIFLMYYFEGFSWVNYHRSFTLHLLLILNQDFWTFVWVGKKVF